MPTYLAPVDKPKGPMLKMGYWYTRRQFGKVPGPLSVFCARLPSGGGLLIAEKLLAEDKTGPTPAHMQSLNMLVCTEGKERTVSEYRALLEAAGFVDVQGRRTGAPLDAVLALKK